MKKSAVVGGGIQCFLWAPGKIDYKKKNTVEKENMLSTIQTCMIM